MQHPQARKIFRRRNAIIEPVFSHLRGQQGLVGFRRTSYIAKPMEAWQTSTTGRPQGSPLHRQTHS